LLARKYKTRYGKPFLKIRVYEVNRKSRPNGTKRVGTHTCKEPPSFGRLGDNNQQIRVMEAEIANKLTLAIYGSEYTKKLPEALTEE